uniref:Uncharacterized protein n=1 Tax=Arundo donax TaxID=35708 RepID=A0A0A8YL75_ARUDO
MSLSSHGLDHIPSTNSFEVNYFRCKFGVVQTEFKNKHKRSKPSNLARLLLLTS